MVKFILSCIIFSGSLSYSFSFTLLDLNSSKHRDFFHTIDPNTQKMQMLETESFHEEEHSNAVQSLRWEEETKTEIKTFADEPNSGTKEQLYSPITKS